MCAPGATVIVMDERAGFGGVEVMAIEHDLFRFYRLNP
jgi:hypothetical protein